MLKKVILAFVFSLMGFHAQAQTTDNSPTGAILDIVFSEVEKRVINDHFGIKSRSTTHETGKEGESRYKVWKPEDKEEDDDLQDDRDSYGKKAKNKKGMGKGKGKNKGMPPGLAKKKSLPKGLAKQLERRGTLPPGLAKRDLPTDLEAKLPPAQEGTERVIVGSDVVLTDKATGVVLDILRNVILSK